LVSRRRTYEPGGSKHSFCLHLSGCHSHGQPIYAEIHKVHLHTVLQRLHEFDLVLNLETCELGRPVDFLGHRVLSEGVWPLLKLVPAIQEYQRPTGMPSLQSFLALHTWFRQVQDFLDFRQLHLVIGALINVAEFQKHDGVETQSWGASCTVRGRGAAKAARGSSPLRGFHPYSRNYT
jgi:hypothetical protein